MTSLLISANKGEVACINLSEKHVLKAIKRKNYLKVEETSKMSAAKSFNAPPANIINCCDFKVYCREVNAYLLNNICK